MKKVVKHGKSLSKIYKFIKDTESLSSEKIKIGIIGPAKLIEQSRESIGLDDLQTLVVLNEKSLAHDCDLLLFCMENVDEIIENAYFLKSISIPSIIILDNVDLLNNDKVLDKIEDIISLKNIIFYNELHFRFKLKSLILLNLNDKKLALGRFLPTFRSDVAREIIDSTSKQNAVIGVSIFLPGADMPLLTINQMKMVIELAALHGAKISIDRIKELFITVGSGFALRTLARQLAGFVPGPGFLVKGFIAYSGTKALGSLVEEYFKRGQSANESND